ncbi:MAG: GNAT family N-acetyltransferase [Prevotella sp.]
MEGEQITDNIIIRRTTIEDIPMLHKLFSTARKFMSETGNPNQWRDGYPGETLLMDDIESGDSYVVVRTMRTSAGEHNRDNRAGGAKDMSDGSGHILATFVLRGGKDPTYNVIYDGQWPDDNPYATIHRIASSGEVSGIFHIVMQFALKTYDTIRLDTHRDNRVMQNAVRREGFRYCGIIHCWSGEERLAYIFNK